MRYDGIFHTSPLLPLALSLILGIAVGRVSLPYLPLWAFLLAVVVALVLALLSRRRPVLQSLFLLVAPFFIGSLLIGIAERDSRVALPAGAVSYEAVVVSEPVERGKTLRFDVIVASGPLQGRTVRASLLKDSIGCRYRRLAVGDGIAARSVLKQPSNFGTSNFDYATYLKAHGVSAQTFIYLSDWRKAVVSLRGLTVMQRSRLSFLCLRHKLIERYRSLGLEGQGFAVAAAMTLGHRTDISPELREAYSAAGVSHVLALSGMHLTVIYMLLSYIFVGRRMAFLRETLIVAVIWVYVFMVGMPPSVVRAAIIITVCSLVTLTGRDRMSLNTLALTALTMLLANPFCLYDVGFQLSFLSVAGILILHKRIGPLVPPHFLQRHRLVAWLWNLFVMSCSAQLATAPLVAYHFGTVSFSFLLSNVVVIPAVTVILYLSAAMLALFFVPWLQQMVVTLIMLVVNSQNTFLLWVASLPWSSVSGLRVSLFQLVLSYVVIVALCLLVRILFGNRVRRLTASHDE